MSKVKNGARYVRCPRCRQVIVEYNCVRIYQCRVCNTNLRAKYYGCNEGSSSLRSTENTSGKQSFLSNELSFTRNEETDNSKQVESLDLSVPFALSSDDHKGKSVINDDKGNFGQVAFGSSDSVITFTRSEHDEKAGSNADSLKSAEVKKDFQLSRRGQEGENWGQRLQSSAETLSTNNPCRYEKVDTGNELGNSPNLTRRHLSQRTSSQDSIDTKTKKRDTNSPRIQLPAQSSAETLSTNNSCRDEKVDPGNELGNNPKLTHRPLSQRTSSQDSMDIQTKKREMNFSPRIQLPAQDLQTKAFHKPSSTERKRFSDDIDIMLTKYQSHRPRDMSLDSEDFVKMQNWLEVKPNNTHKPTRNPKLHEEPQVASATIEQIENVRVEIIKKVDNLRNEINDIFAEMKLGYGFCGKLNQGNYDNCSPGLMKHRSVSCREGRYSSHQCRLEKPPSYPHCGHKPLKLPQGNTHRRSGRTVTPEPQGEAHRHENRREKMREKERRQIEKGYLRPVFGGAPFVTCSNCCKLLQLPEDLCITKKEVCKLQCSACSKVLVFSLSTGDCKISDKAVATSTES